MSADVIIHPSINPRPEMHEIETAWILARYYKRRIEFIAPSRGYKTKSPDIILNGKMWEIKSPTGNSLSSTLRRQLRKSAKQSQYLVLDTSRTKIDDEYILKSVHKYLEEKRKIKKIIIIDKQKDVLEL